MLLRLASVGVSDGPRTLIYPLDLTLRPGVVNVLLGATLAGKTTLLRLIAGLERPSTGRVLEDERDVTGVSVRHRKLAMVYQQFVNYPSLTVYENIASPLRVARVAAKEIDRRVKSIAERLRLNALLDRRPEQLSGGQQQRCALARALVKEAPLVLLDEPLVNLDYKLREELRDELRQLFTSQDATVVYATTDPLEALQLQGVAALLHEGRLLQQGVALDVFHAPSSLSAARAFSDPPLNVTSARVTNDGGTLELGDALTCITSTAQRTALGSNRNQITVAVRAHQLTLERRSVRDVAIAGEIELAEISGSSTFLHLRRFNDNWVAQVPGVHPLPIGSACTLHLNPGALLGFDASNGQRIFGPLPASQL